jgi:hypothetical protein
VERWWAREFSAEISREESVRLVVGAEHIHG